MTTLTFNAAHETPRDVMVQDGDKLCAFQLREMSDNSLGIWMKIVDKRFKRNRQGVTIKQDYDGFHADLIHLCAYYADDRSVPKDIIQGWGPRVRLKLFQECQEMNGLADKFVEDEEKNSGEADTTGGANGSPH